MEQKIIIDDKYSFTIDQAREFISILFANHHNIHIASEKSFDAHSALRLHEAKNSDEFASYTGYRDAIDEEYHKQKHDAEMNILKAIIRFKDETLSE